MRFELLFLGKTRESYLAAGIKDYSRRLAHYIQTDIVTLREKKYRKGESENLRIETENQKSSRGADGNS